MKGTKTVASSAPRPAPLFFSGLLCLLKQKEIAKHLVMRWGEKGGCTRYERHLLPLLLLLWLAVSKGAIRFGI